MPILVPARGCLDALFTASSPSPESSWTTSLLKVTKIFLKVRVGILGSNLISYYRFQDTDRRAARGAIRPYKSKRRLHWLGHWNLITKLFIYLYAKKVHLQIFCLIAQNVRACKNNGGGSDDDVFPFVQDQIQSEWDITWLSHWFNKVATEQWGQRSRGQWLSWDDADIVMAKCLVLISTQRSWP